jgi:hypothetical protein
MQQGPLPERMILDRMEVSRWVAFEVLTMFPKNPVARAIAGTALCGAAAAMSSLAHACACGCGVFDVGTSALLPNGAKSTVFLQYSYLDQPENWSGSSSSPVANNNDKHIRSEFYIAGFQHMFNRAWGVMVEVPYTQRHFITTDDESGLIVGNDNAALGDIRIMGMYTGFSDDMSTGITFGAKLATGDFSYKGFDRDTAIGTGTTDLLLGGYHEMHFGAGNWSGFVQAQLDQALNAREGYRPGTEMDGAAGVYPGGWALGNGMHLTPIFQALVSVRSKDHGDNADPPDSGYQRLLLSPGAGTSRAQVPSLRGCRTAGLSARQWPAAGAALAGQADRQSQLLAARQGVSPIR